MSTTNPTLMQRLIAYNASQRGTPTTPPVPPVLTLEQQVADHERRIKALENR